MPNNFPDILRLYDYALPGELIAQAPADPRDSSRLLVYDRTRKTTAWSTFSKLGDFLPKNAVLVINETKVIPAKLRLKRSTGGRVEALAVGTESDVIRVMANRKLTIGETLRLTDDASFVVAKADDRYWLLRPTFPMRELPTILDAAGAMPLPPYIKHSPLSDQELKEKYQTVFAKNPGSIAAPTASLHFTQTLFDDLIKRGIDVARVTLHVHLGTFAPLTEAQWGSGKLHEETYSIDPSATSMLTDAKRAGRPIIAVGTTSARTLESAADDQGTIVKPQGVTDLFICEGYRFKFIDGLITNFHVPKSSLLMLVAAFAGRETILDLYRQAIERKFRFFSFGDGMVIL